ncbi:MAG: MEDS domain-containing protein [Thaumarchaeota archaeon]|nr:MEDS domain-containing protein [Nitrososphaerota archaeon]
MTQNEGEPTKFIRELKDKSSILVFYEDQRYAKSLGFLFLDMGLKNSHVCLYLSCEATQDVEADMASAGIDVSSSKENNSLKTYNVTNHRKDQITKLIEEFVKNAKNHTSRIIVQHDRFTRAQQHDLLLIEEFIQTLFERHDVSVLNIYNTEFMDDAKFMQQIISIHEYTIFAPDFGKGIVIKTK